MIEARGENSTYSVARSLHVGSLASRVARFFERNPLEELTAADIAIKFGVRQCDVQARLRPHVESGILAVRDECGSGRKSANTPPVTYSAGPLIRCVVVEI